ncbi:hypothetical protein Bca4012_024755 [Brassica carinata]
MTKTHNPTARQGVTFKPDSNPSDLVGFTIATDREIPTTHPTSPRTSQTNHNFTMPKSRRRRHYHHRSFPLTNSFSNHIFCFTHPPTPPTSSSTLDPKPLKALESLNIPPPSKTLLQTLVTFISITNCFSDLYISSTTLKSLSPSLVSLSFLNCPSLTHHLASWLIPLLLAVFSFPLCCNDLSRLYLARLVNVTDLTVSSIPVPTLVSSSSSETCTISSPHHHSERDFMEENSCDISSLWSESSRHILLPLSSIVWSYQLRFLYGKFPYRNRERLTFFHYYSAKRCRSLHLMVFWILFENVMSLHRTKATFIGLLDGGRVNKWIVTEKLGDLKAKSAPKHPKKLHFRFGDRLKLLPFTVQTKYQKLMQFCFILILCIWCVLAEFMCLSSA